MPKWKIRFLPWIQSQIIYCKVKLFFSYLTIDLVYDLYTTYTPLTIHFDRFIMPYALFTTWYVHCTRNIKLLHSKHQHLVASLSLYCHHFIISDFLILHVAAAETFYLKKKRKKNYMCSRHSNSSKTKSTTAAAAEIINFIYIYITF